jgi:hypothetical protein
MIAHKNNVVRPPAKLPMNGVAAAAGFAFAIVLFVGTFIGGTIPPPTHSPASVVQHYVQNRGALLFQSWLSGVAGALLFPPFLVGLAGLVRRSEAAPAPLAGLILIAGLLASVFALTGAAIEGSTAYLITRTSDPAILQAMNDLSRFVLTFIWFPIALLTATAGLAGLRLAVLPRWHALASFCVTVLTLIASLAVFSLRDPIRAGGGLTFATFAVFLIWVLATSTVLGSARPPA